MLNPESFKKTQALRPSFLLMENIFPSVLLKEIYNNHQVLSQEGKSLSYIHTPGVLFYGRHISHSSGNFHCFISTVNCCSGETMLEHLSQTGPENLWQVQACELGQHPLFFCCLVLFCQEQLPDPFTKCSSAVNPQQWGLQRMKSLSTPGGWATHLFR